MIEFSVNVEVDGTGLLAAVLTRSDPLPYNGIYAYLFDPEDRDFDHCIGKIHSPDDRFALSDIVPELWEGVPARRVITWHLLDCGTEGLELVRLLPIVHNGRLKGLTYNEDLIVFRARGIAVPSLDFAAELVDQASCYPHVAGHAIFDDRGQLLQGIRYDAMVTKDFLPSVFVEVEDNEYYDIQAFLFTEYRGVLVPCNAPAGRTTLIALISLAPYGYDVPAPSVGLSIRVRPRTTVEHPIAPPMLSTDYAVRAGLNSMAARTRGLMTHQLEDPFFSFRDTASVQDAAKLQPDESGLFLVKWFAIVGRPDAIEIGECSILFRDSNQMDLHWRNPPVFTISGVLLPMPLEVEVVEGKVLGPVEPTVRFYLNYSDDFANLVIGPHVVTQPWFDIEPVSGWPCKLFFYTACGNVCVQSPGVCRGITLMAVVTDWVPSWPRDMPVVTLRISVSHFGIA